ncbi:MAG: EamA family transporter [Proteobacteria bacterium]|nr:EamA family transporter [Pseudomonadota bacterium]
MIRAYIFLVIAIVFNGTANILMKAGMQNAPDVQDATAVIKHYLTSWPLIIGIVLFGLNVIAWTQALSKLPLSMAYPIMLSMSLLVVVSGSMIFFRETISWWQCLGFALIICGVICVTR